MDEDSAFMRLFRLIFREQKTRLQIDWLTHTDELILERVAAAGREDPPTIAAEIDRSVEYIADRCRQLALRGLLDVDEDGEQPVYRLTELGERYLIGTVDAEELEELAS